MLFCYILRDEWQYPLLIESLFSFGQCSPICLGVLCHDCVSTKKLIARLERIRELWISQIAREMLFWLPASPTRQSISWVKADVGFQNSGKQHQVLKPQGPISINRANEILEIPGIHLTPIKARCMKNGRRN